MPQCENAGDVRRRNHNRKSWFRRSRVRFKIVILDPAGIPLWFDRFGIVGFWKLSHRDESSEDGACLQNEKVGRACSFFMKP